MSRPRSERPVVSQRCKAHSSRTKQPCLKYAMAGQEVCDTHGGRANATLCREKNARMHTAAAGERKAGRFLARMGMPTENVNATAELMRAFAEAVALRDAYRAIIDAEDLDLVQWSKVQGGKPHPVIDLWHAQQDRVVAFGVAIGKLGIAERELRIAEEESERLAGAFLGGLSDERIGMTIEQQQAARIVIAERLRSLS